MVKDARGANSPLKGEQFTGHLVRALASREKWGEGERGVLVEIFKTSDSQHQTRAAVEAVILHPHADFAPPLVHLSSKTPADDTHLRPATRFALRNCLRDDPQAWPAGYDPIYADLALAIPDGKASKYLLGQVTAAKIPPDKLPAAAEHIARYGTVGEQATLLQSPAL